MDLLVYVLAYPFLWIISLLPDRCFYFVSDIVCFLVYRVFGYRRKVVRKNLTLSFPEKSLEEIKEIEKKTYSHFCDVMMETIRVINFADDEMDKRMIFKNGDIFEKYLEEKRSFMVMCGHYNSYEWLLSIKKYLGESKAYVIYSPIANKYFDNLMKKSRLRFNGILLSRYDAAKVIKSNASNGVFGVYGFASDQSPSNSAKQYRRGFMGVRVPVFTGAERMAKAYDIPVFYAKISKIKRGYYCTEVILLSDKPKEEEDYKITDRFFEILESQIKDKPEHYLWTHNRFKYMDK